MWATTDGGAALYVQPPVYSDELYQRPLLFLQYMPELKKTGAS